MLELHTDLCECVCSALVSCHVPMSICANIGRLPTRTLVAHSWFSGAVNSADLAVCGACQELVKLPKTYIKEKEVTGTGTSNSRQSTIDNS